MDQPTPRKFKLISKATRAFFREGRRQPDFSLWDKIHGYVYGRWPYLYIGIGKGEHPLAKRLAPIFGWFKPPVEDKTPAQPKQHSLTEESGTMADGYHGKALPLETARQLVMVNEPIKVPDLEQVIPYVKARAIILENPDHIVALNCPCRRYAENPCLPMDVCLIVGEPFASFVSEHHPETSRWITKEQAVRILEEEDARGHVHHAFFKDAMLGRFYAICNCCECCCGAMNAHRRGTPMLASSGFVAQVQEEMCIGCQTCVDYCQFGALSIGNDGVMEVDHVLCMGCGVCESKCPEGGIALAAAPEKGVPLEIDKLMQAASARK